MALRRSSGSCSVVAMDCEDFGAFGACGDEAVDDVGSLTSWLFGFVVEGLELGGCAHRSERLHGGFDELRVGFVVRGFDELIGAAGDEVGLQDGLLYGLIAGVLVDVGKEIGGLLAAYG